MRKAARFLIITALILGFGVFLLNTKSQVLAQTYNPQSAPVNNPDVPQNLHTYSQNVLIEVMSAVVCQLSGADPINPEQPCLGVDKDTGKIGFAPSSDYEKTGGGGAVGVLSSLISSTLEPPIHTSDFIAYMGQKFGITKNTYAQNTNLQGTGMKGLSPLIPIWVAFRNIVYVLMVLIFVLVGITIMLRVKIDPRTVMSIQNQIPKIIIGIALITFSFAIAGLLIDLMYISIYFIFGIFSTIPMVDLSKNTPADMQQTVINAVGGIGSVSGMASQIASLMRTSMQHFLGIPSCSEASAASCAISLINPLAGISFAKTGSWIAALIEFVSVMGGLKTFNLIASADAETTIPFVGSLVGAGKFAVAAVAAGAVKTATSYLLREGLPWIIVYLIVIITIITTLFRLWLKLLIAYVSILISVILAPFWILTGMIPGTGGKGFSNWFRGLLSNIVVFPVTITMFLIGKVLMDVYGSAQGTTFVPPLVGSFASIGLAQSLIGIGIILLTPNVVNMAQQALKAPKFDVTPIGQAISAGYSPLAAGGKKTWGRLTRLPDPTRGIKEGPLRSATTAGAQELRDRLPAVSRTGSLIRNFIPKSIRERMARNEAERSGRSS